MKHRWIYAVLWFGLLAGFVYLRNRMVLHTAMRAPANIAQPQLWSVPPLVTLPSDTISPAYAAAHFSGSAYKAWLSCNDAVLRHGEFLDPTKIATAEGIAAAEAASAVLKRVSVAMADSLNVAAAVARTRLEDRLPHSAAALADFRAGATRMDSLASSVKQVEADYFLTVDSLIAHVKRTRPAASDDGQMLEFEEDADVAVYNRSLASMRAAHRVRNAALTDLHEHTFELLRQLAAVKN